MHTFIHTVCSSHVYVCSGGHMLLMCLHARRPLLPQNPTQTGGGPLLPGARCGLSSSLEAQVPVGRNAAAPPLTSERRYLAPGDRRGACPGLSPDPPPASGPGADKSRGGGSACNQAADPRCPGSTTEAGNPPASLLQAAVTVDAVRHAGLDPPEPCVVRELHQEGGPTRKGAPACQSVSPPGHERDGEGIIPGIASWDRALRTRPGSAYYRLLVVVVESTQNHFQGSADRTGPGPQREENPDPNTEHRDL
ncbi:unnamed protein product [Lota lota]